MNTKTNNRLIEEKVIGLVASTFGVSTGEVQPKSHLADDFDADSMEHVALMLAVEINILLKQIKKGPEYEN